MDGLVVTLRDPTGRWLAGRPRSQGVVHALFGSAGGGAEAGGQFALAEGLGAGLVDRDEPAVGGALVAQPEHGEGLGFLDRGPEQAPAAGPGALDDGDVAEHAAVADENLGVGPVLAGVGEDALGDGILGRLVRARSCTFGHGVSLPGVEDASRVRRVPPDRGGPDAADRTAVPADRCGGPAAVLHRALVRDDVVAGNRGAVGKRSAHGHRNVAGGGPGRAGALVTRAPVLRSRGVGPRPGRPGAGPRGRGQPGARRSGGHRRGGRHPVPPLRQEGARREVPARRLRQGPGRHRPRQLLCDRRCRGGGAVPGPPGLPAGAVPPAHPQDGSVQDRAGPRDGRPPRQALPGRTIHVVATPRQRGPAWRGLPTRVTFTTRLAANAVLHRTPIRVVLVRGTSQARPYTLAPATTDLASTGGQIVARYASRWSSNSRSRTARTSWAPATPKAGCCPPPSSAPPPWDGRT